MGGGSVLIMMMSGSPQGIKIVSEANLSCAGPQPDITARRTFLNLDTAGWSGGLATLLPQDHRPGQEVGAAQAGEMKEELDLEEEEKRRVRRERNKLAAARCRKRRVEQIDGLQVTTFSQSDREILTGYF